MGLWTNDNKRRTGCPLLFLCQGGQIRHEFLVDFPQRLDICAIAPDAKILPIAKPVSAVYPSGLQRLVIYC